MNQLITKYQIKLFPVLLSLAVLLVTFKIDLIHPSNTGLYVLKILSVPMLAIASLFFTFGKQGVLDVFSKPIKPFRNISIWYLISLVSSFISALILKLVLHLPLQENPGSEHLVETLISLPFVLLFEEIISIFILLVIANFIFKKTKNLVLSQTTGVILSSICFGLLHYSTYFNGSLVNTLIHILLVQGLVRIFLNLAALKSNSIIVPWIIHVVFDFTSFGLSTVLLLSIL